MSHDESETNETQGARMSGAAEPDTAPVSQDASHLEDAYAGVPSDETGARPGGASGAGGAPEAGEVPAEPSVAEIEERLRAEVRAELAAELGTLAELKDRVTGLEREAAAERERASDYMRRWQQAQADLANARRRAQQEQEQLLALAANQASALVLPALDSLERAFNTLPDSLRRLTWVEGISLVEFQLRRVLEAHGVTPFEPAPGDKLDPLRHQAIAEAETSEHPAGSVAQVVQRGYELNGRVLRPALVSIAREPAAGAGASGSDASGSDASGSGASGSAGAAEHEAEPSASGP